MILDAQGREIRKRSVELLPEHLRKLPGELVTKEKADPDKAHAIDAPHVVESIIHDRAEEIKKADDKPVDKPILRAAKPGEYVPLSQQQIDIVRMRVLSSLIDQFIKWAGGDKTVDREDFGVRYLWFPDNNVNNYELRDGNPPSDTDRPKHMRRFELVCDIDHIPKRVHDIIKEYKVV